MAVRRYKKLAVLLKLETVYGTDPTPTGAANALVVKDVTITPLESEEVSRDLMLPYLGNQGIQLAAIRSRVQFSVEAAASGVAGTPPAYGSLLRACGLAEVITAGTSVVYSPVSDNFESATIYWNADGVRHVLLGSRGTLTAEFVPSKIPYWKFDLIGLTGTVTDSALPAVTTTGFKTPLMVNKANTTLTMFGAAQVAESINIDLGQKVEPRFLIGSETIETTDRSATGTVVVEAKALSVVDWFANARARTRGAFVLVHGVTAGAIIQVDASQTEIGKPTQGQTQNILNYSLPVNFCTNTGNDELTFTFK